MIPSEGKTLAARRPVAAANRAWLFIASPSTTITPRRAKAQRRPGAHREETAQQEQRAGEDAEGGQHAGGPRRPAAGRRERGRRPDAESFLPKPGDHSGYVVEVGLPRARLGGQQASARSRPESRARATARA